MRSNIKSYKYKYNKYEIDMRMELVGGNTCGIARSRRNERQMKASKAIKGERENLTRTPDLRMLTNIPNMTKAPKTLKMTTYSKTTNNKAAKYQEKGYRGVRGVTEAESLRLTSPP